MDFLQELNEAQYAAVTQTEGPVMIIAGPGSGKTRVLTYRLAYMVQQGIDPFNILCLTFTNKAADEMRHRIESIVGKASRGAWMGTFHSVFARCLRMEGHKLGYPSHFTIYDTDDAKTLLKQVIKEVVPEHKIKFYKENSVLWRISQAKNALIGPKEYANNDELTNEDHAASRELIKDIYMAYVQQCFQNQAMDFDDLLINMWRLLQRHADVAHKFQHRFKYIMIDEFQDTNTAQYEIIKILASVHENLCVVGDDAQSIYAFRGATIKNILQFESQFSDLKTIKLEQNYRSTQAIVSAANTIIGNNKHQLKKSIFTQRQGGDLIQEIVAGSDNDEGRMIADRIFDLKMRKHYFHKDFAILYRTNAQSRSFEEALRRLNIPYKIFGGISFYQRKEVKDVIAYLRCIVNPADAEALKRIINIPTRGIGATTINKVTVLAQEQGVSFWEILCNIHSQPITSRARTDIEGFVYLIKSLQLMLTNSTAHELALETVNRTKLLTELNLDKSVEGISRYENVMELLNSIKEFSESDVIDDDSQNTDRSLASYLQQITLLTDADREGSNQADVVKLMTVHAAKGLEFSCVFLVGLEENLFPSVLSISSREELEEERRLFYVAITRAKDILMLSHAKTRYKFGKLEYGEPSRFLDEINETDINRVTKSKSSIFEEYNRSNTNKGIQTYTKNISSRIASNSQTNTENFEAHDLSQLQVRSKVLHQKFGKGIVEKIDGNGTERIALIVFEQGGSKKILLRFAKMQVME